METPTYMVVKKIDKDNQIGLLEYFINKFSIPNSLIEIIINDYIITITSEVSNYNPNIWNCKDPKYINECILDAVDDRCSTEGHGSDIVYYLLEVVNFECELVSTLSEIAAISNLGKSYYQIKDGRVYTYYDDATLLSIICSNLIIGILRELTDKLIPILEGSVAGVMFVYTNMFLYKTRSSQQYPDEIMLTFDVY